MKPEIAKTVVDSAEKLGLNVKLQPYYGTTGLAGTRADITKAIAYAAYRFGAENLPLIPGSQLQSDMKIEDFIEELDFQWDQFGFNKYIAY